MKEVIVQRLRKLNEEVERGKTSLQDLELKQMRLRETLLRISGAIQVLEELLAEYENNLVNVDHNIHPPVPPDPSEMDNRLPDAP
jgi:predicted nuclease with TOPRIM domain